MIADRAETSALNSPHVTNRGYLGYEIARKAKAISDERIRRLLFLLHQRAKQDGGLGDVASEYSAVKIVFGVLLKRPIEYRLRRIHGRHRNFPFHRVALVAGGIGEG